MKSIGSWFVTKFHQFFRFLKEEPRRVSAFIIAFTALSQLALSQIHIEALVRVKLTVSTPEASNFTAGMPSIGIGMFQFLFLLFGLVTIFNAIRAHSKKQQIAAVVAILVTLAAGIVFYLKMSNPDNVVEAIDIAKSVQLLTIGFIGYLVGLAFILYRLLFRKGV
jgi:hypothetical protein